MTDEPPDLTTEAGARAWFEEIKRTATERFRRHGHLSPTAIFLATRDDSTGLALPTPRQVIVVVDGALLDPGGDGKDKLARAMRRWALLYEAVGFACAMEVWELADTDIKPRTKSWENVPGRTEAISVTAQHRTLGDKTYGFVREIIRGPRGAKVKLAPWREGVARSGRWAGVLAPAAQVAEASEASARLVKIAATLTPPQRRDLVEFARQRLYDEGTPREVCDMAIRSLIGRFAEAGSPVAPRPEDLTATRDSANDAGPRIDVVNVDEWGKG